MFNIIIASKLLLIDSTKYRECHSSRVCHNTKVQRFRKLIYLHLFTDCFTKDFSSIIGTNTVPATEDYIEDCICSDD